MMPVALVAVLLAGCWFLRPGGKRAPVERVATPVQPNFDFVPVTHTHPNIGLLAIGPAFACVALTPRASTPAKAHTA